MTVQTDADVAQGWARNEPGALDAAVSRHAADLLLAAAWLTGHPDAAQDAVRATFVRAAGRVGRLRDGARLQEWLFAVLRNECLLRPVPPARDVPVAPGPVGGGDVWTAAQALDGPEREVFALHVCSGLDVDQLAAALGIKVGAAVVRVAEMRLALSEACTSLSLVRDGTDGCGSLLAVAGDGSAPFTSELRARVDRHAAACARCGGWAAPLTDPLAVIDALPAVPVPFGLPGRIRAGLETTGDLDALPPLWSWRDDGFPVPFDGRPGRTLLGLSWSQVGAVGLVAVLVVAAAFGAAAVWPRSAIGDVVAGARATVTNEQPDGADDLGPGALPEVAPQPTPTVPSAAPTTSPTTTPTPSAVPTPSTATSAGTRPGTTTPENHGRPVPPPAAPDRVSFSAGRVDLAEASSRTVRVTATGSRAATFRAQVSGAGLSVTPASGALAPGQSVDLDVRLARRSTPEGVVNGALTVAFGQARSSVPVSATVRRPPAIANTWVTVPYLWTGGSRCRPQSARVGVAVADESAMSAVLVWSPDGRKTLRQRMTWGGGRFYAPIGPFRVTGSRTATVTVTDDAGARATSTVSVDVFGC